jgi:hypothetical protein
VRASPTPGSNPPALDANSHTSLEGSATLIRAFISGYQVHRSGLMGMHKSQEHNVAPGLRPRISSPRTRAGDTDVAGYLPDLRRERASNNQAASLPRIHEGIRRERTSKHESVNATALTLTTIGGNM